MNLFSLLKNAWGYKKCPSYFCHMDSSVPTVCYESPEQGTHTLTVKTKFDKFDSKEQTEKESELCTAMAM